jgi:hypothetical protein
MIDVIHTKRGLVPIEAIKRGDEVLSRNHATGKLEYERVTGVIQPHPDRLMQINFAGEAQPLQPTATHPFFVKHAGETAGGWAEASVIKVGDAVLTTKGTWSQVTAVSSTQTEATVYNFEVEANHDYFVGDSGLLVHNPCGVETFFRAMSETDYQSLLATGELPATGETFISTSSEYAAQYNGVLVQFNMAPGTTQALAEIGVRDVSDVVSSTYPDMPLVSRGWGAANAFFKGEGNLINIGLGHGEALDLFNSMIQGFSEVQ